MNLDDLKTTWNAETRDALRINTRAAPALLHSEGALQRHRRSVVIELILNAVVLLALGSFLAEHVREPRFFFPGLVLHLSAIALTGAAVRQLVHLHGIEYGGPVTAIQKQLAQLRIEWIVTTKWTLIAAPLLWVPLLVVGVKALLGLDAWALFDTAWIVSNVVFGVVVLLAMLWIAHRYGERMHRSPLMKRWMDALAGRSLQAATRFIDDVAEFEKI
jgi:hypothetical protein